MAIEIVTQPPKHPAIFIECDTLVGAAIDRDGEDATLDLIANLDVAIAIRPALEAVRAAGFLVMGIANKPDAIRSPEARHALAAFYERLGTTLALDAVLVCWHDMSEGCGCRMPKDGLLFGTTAVHRVTLGLSYVIGTSHSAIAAGRRSFARTMLVGDRVDDTEPFPHVRASSLQEGLVWIAERIRRGDPRWRRWRH